MHDDAPPPHEAHFTTEEGWHWAERAFAGLFNFCPDPGELARQCVLPRAAWRSIVRWLLPLERFVRRLQLLEALALPAFASARAATRAPEAAARGASLGAPARPRALAGDDPDAWRVSFRLVAGEGCPARRRAESISIRIDPIVAAAPRLQPSLALAARVEALGRVFAAPGVYARRLARRLAQCGARVAARIIGAVRPPARDDPIGADLDRESHEACRSAAARRFDSS